MLQNRSTDRRLAGRYEFACCGIVFIGVFRVKSKLEAASRHCRQRHLVLFNINILKLDFGAGVS
jgi:hypothetical protein